MFVLIPYLHFIGIMSLMGALITQHLVVKPSMGSTAIKTVGTVDIIFGIAAAVVLATGLLRWFVYGKGSDFYLANPMFHIKITLFFVVAIISIFPTLRILKWRRQSKQDNAFEVSSKDAKRLLMFIRIELLITVIIPLLAVMVSQGRH